MTRRLALAVLALLLLGISPGEAGVAPMEVWTGNVRCLDGSAAGWLYAGTHGGGVLRSSDGGAAWSRCGATGLSRYIQDIAVAFSGNVYAATDAGTARSTDEGQSWSLVSREPALALATAMSVGQLETVWIGTEGSGLLRFREGDQQPEAMTRGTVVAQVRGVSVHPQLPERIVIGTQLGIFVSSDGGATWQPRSSGLLHLPVRALCGDPTDPQRLFVSTQRDDHHTSVDGKIYRSTDGGLHWTVVMEELHLVDLSVDPRNPERVAVAAPASGVFQSDEGGAPGTFGPRNEALPNISSHAVHFTDGWLYAGTVQGVFRHQEAPDPWVWRGQGFRAARVSAVESISGDGSGWIIGCREGGIWRSTDSGSTWLPSNTGLHPERQEVLCLAVDPVNPSWVYAGFNGQSLYRSSNGGQTWWTPGSSGWPRVEDILVDPTDPARIYCLIWTVGVLRSPDRGSSWDVITGNIDWAHHAAVGVLPASPNVILVGETDGDLYRSTDNGGSYQPIKVMDWIWLRNTVRAIHCGSGVGGPVTLATNRGLLRSTNGGQSFVSATPGLANLVFHCVTSAPGAPSTLYAGADDGRLFRSTDQGASWSEYAPAAALPAQPITSLAVHPTRPGELMVGLDGVGLYRVAP